MENLLSYLPIVLGGSYLISFVLLMILVVLSVLGKAQAVRKLIPVFVTFAVVLLISVITFAARQ